MSAYIQRLIHEHAGLDRTAKAVLTAIAKYSDDSGEGAYPGIKLIMQESGFKERAVQNAISRAVKAGCLIRIFNAGPNETNVYRLRPDRLRGAAPCTPAPRAPNKITIRAGRSYSAKHSPSSSSPDLGPGFNGREQAGARQNQASPRQSKSSRPGEPYRKLTPPEAWAKAVANGFLSCPDCGAWLGRCHCGGYIAEGFDAATKDALAGKPSPAQLKSAAALKTAYVDWKPGVHRQLTQADINADWDAYEAELMADPAYRRQKAIYDARVAARNAPR